MFDFKRNTGTEPAEVSEKLKYSKYYEHDGTLRAYANRAMVLAGAMTLLAFVSLGFAVYVRMQPPTIIRVSADGESSVISGRPLFRNQSPSVLADARQSPQPQSYEKEAFVRQFLDHYLNYDMHNVSLQWATALNSMTSNLKSSALRVMEKDNTVGKIEDENTRSIFLCCIPPTECVRSIAWMKIARSSRPRSISTESGWRTRTVRPRTRAECW
jgi:hypothetical protein